jgi:hypothetical protein
MYKFFVKNLALFIGSLIFTFPALSYAENPACSTDSSGAVSGVSGWSGSSTACGITPETQRITLRRVSLCRSAPTAPTTSTAYGASMCSNTIFSGTAGREITIATGATTSVSDPVNTNIPGPATYTHALVILDPTIILQAQSDFDGTVTAADGTSGTKCWTKASSMYFQTAIGWLTTSCGATASTLGEATVYINKLGGANNTQETFTGSQGQLITAYLIDSSGKLVSSTTNDSLGSVTYILGLFENPTALTIVKQNYRPRHSIQMYWANRTAALVDMASYSPNTAFRAGVFDAYFTYNCGGHPNCP